MIFSSFIVKKTLFCTLSVYFLTFCDEKKRVMRYNILLIALLVLSVQSCINPIKQKNPEPVVVSGVLVRRDTIAVRESFISSLTPNYVAIVQPRVNGYLAAKLFSNGMPVKRGEVIFRIDNRKQSADVLSAAEIGRAHV